MCGRARCTLTIDDIPRACQRTNGLRYVNADRYRPSYNLAPGSNLPVIRRDDESDGEGVVVHCMKWGLIPSFTKKTEKPDFYKMFNARSESISEKASFRRLLPKNRCLVAVEGFYEWKKDGSRKQPYYIHLKDGRPLVFAALYDSWQSSEDRKPLLKSLCLSLLILDNHINACFPADRMPVILGDKGSTDLWLKGSSSSKFDMILKPYEDPDLVWYPVTPAMGKPSFDGPECIKEIRLKTEGKNHISNFFMRKEREKEDLEGEEKSSVDEFVKTNLPKWSEKESPQEVQEEQESNLAKNTFDISAERNLPKSLKEEPVTADDVGTQFATEKGDKDLTSSPIFHNEASAKSQIKRDYERFLADSTPVSDRFDKLRSSPAKRKGNQKEAGDKQPTLFSYFYKK